MWEGLFRVGAGGERTPLSERLQLRALGLHGEGTAAGPLPARGLFGEGGGPTPSERAAGEVLLDATAAQDSGIDVVGSEYATIAAESSALERLASAVADQIVARLAVFADRGGGQAADVPAAPGGQ